MMKKLALAACLVFIWVVFISSAGIAASDGPILIRFSHVVSENTPKGVGAKMFKELTEKRLKGKVEVEIYPSSQKYTDGQAILALVFGDLEMAAPSFPKFRQYTKALQIFDLPFLFQNVDDVHAFQNSAAGQGLLSSMEGLGLTGLGYWDNGMRVLSANKMIRHPDQLKGLAFRIESSLIFQEQYRRFDALAIPMPFKRLPDALREGVVDGYENAWSNIFSKKLHKLRNHFTEVEATYLGYMVVASKAFWDGLPSDIRGELERIIDEVTVEVNRLAKEKESADKKLVLADKDVTLTKLSAEEKKIWKDAMLPIWDQYRDEIGSELLGAAEKAAAEN